MGDALISETFQDGHYVSQFRHKKSVLEVVCGLGGEDFEVLIGLAGAAFRQMKESVNNLSYADALKKAIDAADTRAATATSILEEKYRTEFRLKENEHKRNLQAKATEADEIRSELAVAKATAQAAEARLQTLKGQLGDAENVAWEKFSKEKADYKEEFKQRLAEIDVRYAALLKEGKDSNAALLKEFKELCMKEAERLRKENDKGLVSSEKGKTGEKEFDELCHEYTKWGPLENTSKQTAAADRRVTIRGCICLFELKNYTSTVDTDEVNKFKRDMAHNKEVGLGVFISFHTNIAKMGERYINVEWSVDSQMLIYINAFYTHPIADILTFIDGCVEAAKHIHGTAGSDDSDLQPRIEIAKGLVQRELARISGIITSLKQNNKAVIDLLNKQYVAMDLEMKSTKESLKSMLDALIGKEAEAEVQAEVQIETQDNSSLETVSPKEPKKRSKKIDAKSK
jgi:hypothetical protein